MKAHQLKNAILQLAVQGKLVPQNPNDEPASKLLERIAAEKQRRIKAGEIKKDKRDSTIVRRGASFYEIANTTERCIDDELPFDLPNGWEWCRVGDLFSNMSGLAYKKDALAIKTDKMIRVLRGGNIGEEHFLFKGDDVFISSELVKPELYLRKNYMITPAVSSLDHIGKIALIDKDYSDTVVGGFVLMLIPHFNNDVVSQYLLYAFAAKHHRDNCRNITHKSGQAFYNLSREQMMNLPVPIPPLAEQRRIVDRLESLLPLVEAYGKAEAELSELDARFPDMLKKSILQDAVQGKLVPQNPNDEPASVLLERIRAEKQRLIKEGKIKKDKHESVIFRRDNSHYEKLDGVERCIDGEIPFEIPENWCWCKIGTVFTLQAGKNIQAAEIHENPFPDSYPCYGGNGIRGYVASLNRTGDYPIIGRQGALCGNINRATGEFYATEHAVCVETYSQISVAWACLFLTALNLNQYATATAQPGLAVANINEVYIPLPPLAEQHRIVQRIEELLPLVKGL